MKKFRHLLHLVISFLLAKPIQVFAEDGYDTGVQTITGDTTVAFTNTREGTIPTGIIMDMWPYLLIVLIALVCIVVFAIMKNKRREA